MTKNEKIAVGTVAGALLLYTTKKRIDRKRKNRRVIGEIAKTLEQFVYDIQFDEIARYY